MLPSASFLLSSSFWSFHLFFSCHELADDLVPLLEGFYLGTDPTLDPALQRNVPGQDGRSASCHLRVCHKRRHGQRALSQHVEQASSKGLLSLGESGRQRRVERIVRGEKFGERRI